MTGTPPATAPAVGTRVCALADLTPELGVAALVDGEQVAIFLLADGSLHCVQNLDPFSGSYVMSRGITGSRGDAPTIASPLYKQVFSLVDGTCLVTMDKEPKPGLSPDLVVHSVRIEGEDVVVALHGGA
jgi:nitrite reductase (NADH) small subunit